MGAGGAGEPGCLAVHGAEPADDLAAGRAAAASRAGCGRLAGRRLAARCTRREQAALVDGRVRVPEGLDVLHRPRDRGARRRDAARRRSRLAWLAERLRTFVDLNPEFEIPVERLATWLARLDDDDPDED